MAKMFYTLEETADKLGVTAQRVKEMAASGQLQEFRDRDKLVFKREQVDTLSGGGDDGGIIPLADSGGPIGLADDARSGSGSSPGLGSLTDPAAKERSGISIFEADELDDTDPSAQTQVSNTQVPTAGMGDLGGSGSGLLDLTRQGDDTAAGANLLGNVYGDQAGDSGGTGQGQALFEPAGVASDVSSGGGSGGAPVFYAMSEQVDPTWSGITGGLALALVLVLGAMVAVTTMALSGASAALINSLAGNLWIIVGGFAAAAGIFAVIGMLIGKKA
jgi:hypothetical protein